MAVSKFTSASGGNDFNVNVGSTYSVVNFTQEYAAGAYSFTSAQLDITMDVYAYDGLGNLAGYTNGKGLITTTGFNKLVIIGGTVGDVLSFSYKTTYASVAETAELTAGPVILSATPTSLPNVNSTTVVTGLNFATDITASFKGSDNLVRAAKSVVRGSANSLVVTRPDALPTAQSPYSLTVINPSVVNQPTGSSANILTGFTSGSNPVWVTTVLPPSIFNTSYSATLSATDADAGSSIVSYTLISGTLPTGLSLNTTTGAITGTPTGTGPTTSTISFRATDLGGNYTDKSLTFFHYGNTAATDSTYYYQVFTANGNFTAPVALTADVLIIAGGGGGGPLGGGAGAGGVLPRLSTSLLAQSYTVIVGSGGPGGAGGNGNIASKSVQGVDSSFGSIGTATGGGYGGNYSTGTGIGFEVGGNGGSGGGSSYSSSATFGSGNTPATTPSQGNNGGQSRGNPYLGGGGGGAGGAGINAGSYDRGDGGPGTTSYAAWLTAITPLMTSISGWATATTGGAIAGGGGGSRHNAYGGTPGLAGTGGATAGTATVNASNAQASTGSGGGGGGYDAGNFYSGGNGGSGLVVVRYTKASVGG